MHVFTQKDVEHSGIVQFMHPTATVFLEGSLLKKSLLSPSQSCSKPVGVSAEYERDNLKTVIGNQTVFGRH